MFQILERHQKPYPSCGSVVLPGMIHSLWFMGCITSLSRPDCRVKPAFNIEVCELTVRIILVRSQADHKIRAEDVGFQSMMMTGVKILSGEACPTVVHALCTPAWADSKYSNRVTLMVGIIHYGKQENHRWEWSHSMAKNIKPSYYERILWIWILY